MPPQDPMTELANFFQGVSVETSEPTIEKPVSKTIKSSDYLVDTQNPTVINKANVGKIVSEMTYDEAASMLHEGESLKAVYHPDIGWRRTIVGEGAGRERIPKYIKFGPLYPGQQYLPDMSPIEQSMSASEEFTPSLLKFSKGVAGALEDVGKRFYKGNEWYERNEPESGWESVGRFIGSVGGVLPANEPFSAQELQNQSFLEQSLMAVGIPGTMSIPGASLGIRSTLFGGLKSVDNIPVPDSLAVTKLRHVLQTVKEQKPAQQAAIKAGRASRSTIAAQNIEEGIAKDGDAIEVVNQSLRLLKGELDTVLPKDSLAHLDEIDMQELASLVLNASKQGLPSGKNIRVGDKVVDFYDYITNMTALNKIIWGEKLPQAHEIRRLEKIFGTGFIDDAVQVDRSLVGNVLNNVWNLPKTLVASIDMSMPGRQGWKLMLSPYWKQWFHSFGAQFKLMDPVMGELQYDIITKSITDNKYYHLAEKLMPIMERSGATARTLNATEDAYMSNYARFIPGAEISERIYTGSLNKLRFDSFYKQIDDWTRSGFEYSQKDLDQLADFILMSTGRGKISKWLGGESPYAVSLFNALFFSPRYIAGTVQFYGKSVPKTAKFLTKDLPAQSSFLRKATSFNVKGRQFNPLGTAEDARNIQVSKYWASTLAGHVAKGMGILGTFKMAEKLYPELNVEIGLDPRATDFGQVRIGDGIRYDFWGGDMQYAKFLARAYYEERTNPITGEEIYLSRPELLESFIRSKLSPSAAATLDYTFFKDDFYGNEIRYDKESQIEQAKQRLLFMFAQDLADVVNLERSRFNDPIWAAPSFLGVGVQAYETATDIKNDLAMRYHDVLYDDLLDLEDGDDLQYNIDTHEDMLRYYEERQAKRPPENPDEAYYKGMSLYANRIKELEDGSERTGDLGIKEWVRLANAGEISRTTLNGKIKKYLSSKSEAFMTAISHDVEIVKESRMTDLVDIWRSAYWNVPLHFHPKTGIPDYDRRDSERENMIIQAQDAGIETPGMTARDLLTSRRPASTDDAVAEAIRSYQEGHEWLREVLYDKHDQYIKDRGHWDYYQLWKSSDYKDYFRKTNKEFDQVLKEGNLIKQGIREFNPEVERMMLQLGIGITPVNEIVKQEYISNAPFEQIAEAQQYLSR